MILLNQKRWFWCNNENPCEGFKPLQRLGANMNYYKELYSCIAVEHGVY